MNQCSREKAVCVQRVRCVPSCEQGGPELRIWEIIEVENFMGLGGELRRIGSGSTQKRLEEKTMDTRKHGTSVMTRSVVCAGLAIERGRTMRKIDPCEGRTTAEAACQLWLITVYFFVFYKYTRHNGDGYMLVLASIRYNINITLDVHVR